MTLFGRKWRTDYFLGWDDYQRRVATQVRHHFQQQARKQSVRNLPPVGVGA